MRKSVIIVAGGSGKRMGTAIPKQFLRLSGKTILQHTLEQFFQYDKSAQLIVVLPKDHISRWNDEVSSSGCNITHVVVEGGTERFYSVRNGLTYATGDYIAVHDAVRPLVDLELIERCFDALKINDAIIPVIPVTNSLRKLDNEGSKAVDRAVFRAVQTPQCFKYQVLKQAYKTAFSSKFTDDASVVEYSGHKISFVEGAPRNIKITTPEDLVIAEALLSSK